MNLAAYSENFPRIQREPAIGNVAGGISVKKIVRVDTVKRKQIASVALAIGDDSLITQTFIRARSGQEIRVHTGRQNRELGEASCAERNRLNQFRTHRIAIGRVGLIEERRGVNRHRRRHRARLETGVHCRGAASLHHN